MMSKSPAGIRNTSPVAIVLLASRDANANILPEVEASRTATATTVPYPAVAVAHSRAAALVLADPVVVNDAASRT